ncbi:MAG: hypothetical protein H6720_16115 [Sandaracinus sp.]|nr:hypothetical protein [Sandaracinus sp.]
MHVSVVGLPAGKRWSTSRRMRLCLLCLALALGCGDNGPGPAGDPCLTSVECEDGTVCFPTQLRGRECMAVCDPSTTRLCSDGSVCLASATTAVCYTGGELAEGSVCGSSDACAPGAVCVNVDGAAESTCRRACDRRTANGCALDQVCEPVGDEPAGVCLPPADE